jgi:hypothetical protein
MITGISSGLASQKPDANRYKWAATHCLQLDNSTTATSNYVTATHISKIVEAASAGATDDLGENITVAFWVSPLWGIGTRDGTANSVLTGTRTSDVVLFSLGKTTEFNQFVQVVYLVRSGSSLRGRLRARVQGDGGHNINERALSDVNSICGLGTSGAASLWDKDNKGNVNSEGFCHIAITRGSGTADPDIYWNGQDINANIDVSSNDPDIQESEVDGMILGEHTDAIENGTDLLTPMKFRDLVIYNSALSASNIAELYNSGNFYDVRTSSTAAVAAPGVYYPFNHNYADYMRNGGDMNGNQAFVAL